MDPLKYINKMIEMYEGPRITAQEPRMGLAGGQLVQPGVGRQGYAGDFASGIDKQGNSYRFQSITGEGTAVSFSPKKYGSDKKAYDAALKYRKTWIKNNPAKSAGAQALLEGTGVIYKPSELKEGAKYWGHKTYDEAPYKIQQRIRASLKRGDGTWIDPLYLGRDTSAERRTKFFKTEGGKQLKWVADNGKNYSSPENMLKDFKKKFKVKNLPTSALFKNASSRASGINNLSLGMLRGNKYNIIGAQTKRGSNVFNALNYKSGKELELFKLSILQNNSKVQNNFSKAFADITEDAAILRKESRLLGVDDALKTLNKTQYNLFKDFGFIKGGTGSGSVRNTLVNQGITDEQLFNFQEVRYPITHTDNIIKSLQFAPGRKAFNLTKTEAARVISGWDRVSLGFDDANDFVKGMDKYLGEGKFKKVFGNTTFEHVLAKEFGKRYKSLPKDLLLSGKYSTGSFNILKLKTFDKPLLSLVEKYNTAIGNNKKVIGQQIQDLYNDFNARTNNYLKDFKPEFKEKVSFKFSKPAFSDVGRYEESRLAAKEMRSTLTMKNLTEGTGKYKYSKDQLNLFSKQQKKIEKFLNTASKTFQDLSPQSVLQMGRTHGCLKKQEGGSIMRCLQTKFKADPEKFLQRSATLAKGNPNLLKWFKTGKNIARGTGVFALWEGALAPVLMGWMATEGESWDRMKHDLAYGPILEAFGVSPDYIPGISTKEEFMEEAGGDEAAYAAKRLTEISEQELPSLYQQRDDVINKMAHVEGKGYHQRTIEDDIKEKQEELQGIWNKTGFMEGPAASYLNEAKAVEAFNTVEEVKAKIAADKEARKKDYKIEPIHEFFKSLPRMASGGLANLTRTEAPDSGPMQGLASTPEYATYRKEYKWQT